MNKTKTKYKTTFEIVFFFISFVLLSEQKFLAKRLNILLQYIYCRVGQIYFLVVILIDRVRTSIEKDEEVDADGQQQEAGCKVKY
jgi:hypothetical protein